ncbi:hypothetical protein [Demequina phytophila]|uniref:hypothetical protein n=1 Tax=Demequina phytophila TaxID=1638981 RepID=UPI0007803E1B|nr:hypothetical protein [Demequina phytophila]
MFFRRRRFRARVLVHIGMHKSATTVIQRAARAERPSLVEQGVTYPGKGGNHKQLTETIWAPKRPLKGDSAPERRWDALVAEVAGAQRRAFISAEHLAVSRPRDLERMAASLGDDTQVVITVRPLLEMVPSIWQQFVKERRSVPFHDWLEDVFRGDRTSETTPQFWRRHDLGELVATWREAFPKHPVVVVTLDKARPGLLFESFEQLLGVKRGTFVAPSGDGYATNRGLSTEEAELLREVNALTDDAPDDYYPYIRNGMVASIQAGRKPERAEGTLRVPEEFREAILEVAREGVARARSLGVIEIGDLDRYADPGRAADSGHAPAPGSAGTGSALHGAVDGTTVHGDTVALALAGIASRATGNGVLYAEAGRAEARDADARDADAVDAAAPPAEISEAAADEIPAPPQPSRITVVADHDLYGRLRAAGVDAVEAWRAARLTRGQELSGSDQVTAPLCRPAAAPEAAIGAAWGTAWARETALAALEGLEGPIDVDIELPGLTALVSRTWERALVLGVETDFDEWVADAAAGAIDARACLPDPAGVVALVDALQGHQAIGTMRVVTAPAPTARRIDALESGLLRDASRHHQGTDASLFGIAHVLLDGSVAALRRHRPLAVTPVASPDALTPYLAARARALEELEARGLDVSGVRAWAHEEDASPAAPAGTPVAPDAGVPAGGPVPFELATAAIAGAYAVASGLDPEFTPGMARLPMRRWGWR